MILAAKDRIFPSIDVDTLDEAKRLMDQMVGLVGNVKFGLQLATRESWVAGIVAAHERGFKVFCDAKFKDIPNTVEHAAGALTYHRPDFFTAMADNSLEALQVIRKGVDQTSQKLKIEPPKIIGVTVLTSISEKECKAIYGANPAEKVLMFASNSVKAGFDAIVCSPEEVKLLRSQSNFANTLLITPGVRPSWAASNDQKRATTPAEAIKNGADMLVIGRPITAPPAKVGSTKKALELIIEEIEGAMQ